MKNLTVKIPVLRHSDAIFSNWLSWNLKQFQYNFWALNDVAIIVEGNAIISIFDELEPSSEDFLRVPKNSKWKYSISFLG